ncbi:hypothetical protein Q2534_001344 [Salmonella enterica]|nr:hypothetical protein [Salmonella enterica]
MAKTQMKYLVRAWKKELKKPEWNMGSRKQRKACARNFAAISAAGCAEWCISVGCQDDADDVVAEEICDE